MTRAELQAAIDLLLVDDPESQVTRPQLNALLSDILNNVVLQDESANKCDIASVNITDPSQGLQVSGAKVIGAQQEIMGPLMTTDDISVKVNELLTALANHGLILIVV